MTACPSCGRENADDARFCSACGSTLALAEAPREQREVVTVLFCDLVGSTALGESTDPEALRARMRRYFEDLRAILERHGGQVEKFVGDAVMAVFGIPTAHEDDALRAVRAASQMRAAIAEHGLEARIGINTGEVVVGGEGETLVTGDAVNVAARLEQAAPNGEILIGAETRLLVRDAVRAEAVAPLALKGKSEPVEAYRLLEVLGDAAPLARHPETPLVGRERERQRLWRAYEDAVADRSCQLFTLLGPAGIGKSRLVADFLERVDGSADVLRGRCLSYGEGITYWPLVEMLIAVGVEPDSVIGSSPPETQLAFRRLLESGAVERPQVVVIDDLQWAEPVFVDLVEHVADLSRGAPIFLLCVARTELLDARPGWGGGKLNATSLLLEPLGAHECVELMERLGAHLDDALRERIITASAGNPLYVEEMLAMVREQGSDGEVAVPPTIHALLQARIDALESDVRVVMERGAVEGEVFHRGAVAVLSPEPVREDVESHLTTLVRKELIRSTPPTFPGDEGYRFRHLLIRDAAYESLPKATRAELHERFADWLGQHDLVESDEIVGYHLEQAHRYRAELDPGDARLRELGMRAAPRLAAAGTSALDRGDFTAGRTLLARALSLSPDDDPERDLLGVELSYPLRQIGEREEASTLLARARRSPDAVTRALALLECANVGLKDGSVPRQERERWREQARSVLEQSEHELGLARYWRALALEASFTYRASDLERACVRAIELFERCGWPRRFADPTEGLLIGAYAFGPTPVDEALVRLDEIDHARRGVLAQAFAAHVRGVLLAMRGDVERARELCSRAGYTFEQAGLHVAAAAMALGAADVEFRAGAVDAQESILRASLGRLEELGDRDATTIVGLELGACLAWQESWDSLAELLSRISEIAGGEDVFAAVRTNGLAALLSASAGDHENAARSSEHAGELAESTDYFEARAWARAVAAEVFRRARRFPDAATQARDALSVLTAKGDVAGRAQFAKRFARLGIDDT